MLKQEFTELFLKCAHDALAYAEKKLGMPLSDDFDVELHGAGVSGEIISRDRALELLYLGEDRFWRIIDVGVKAVVGGKPRLFVRSSGHEPSSFEETCNTPPGNGPFKVVELLNIHVED